MNGVKTPIIIFHALLCLLLGIGLVLAELSPAQAQEFYKYDPNSQPPPAGSTNLEIQDSFRCKDDGSADGVLFINQACSANEDTWGEQMGLMANIVCKIESLLGSILGNLYCGVQVKVLGPVLAALTLYITIYGAMVTLGMIPQTFSKAILHVVKIGLVAALALNAEFAIKIGYTFYMGATQSFLNIIFDSYTNTNFSHIPKVDELSGAGYMMNPNCDDLSDPNGYCFAAGTHWMSNIDAGLDKLFGFFMDHGWIILILLVTLFMISQPLFFIILAVILSIIKAFATAIMGYLLALVGITFLFSMAPIFITLSLFKVTGNWFNTWLQHLASYTIQMVITFTFLLLMLMVDMITFLQQVGSLIRSYPYVIEFGFITIPVANVVSLCKVERIGGENGEIKYFNIHNGSETSFDGQPLDQFSGFPQCVPFYDAQKIIAGSAGQGGYPPGLDAGQVNVLKGELEPDKFKEAITEIVSKANQDNIIPVMEVFGHSDLVFFLLSRFLIMIILTYLLERFMAKVPFISTQLAGTNFSGRLGGGEMGEGDHTPGLQSTENWAGLEGGLARFRAATMRPPLRKRAIATVRGAAEGHKARAALKRANPQKYRELYGSPVQFAARSVATAPFKFATQRATSLGRGVAAGAKGTIMGIGEKAVTGGSHQQDLMRYAQEEAMKREQKEEFTEETRRPRGGPGYRSTRHGD